jgi:glycosyltransferase involved in cell wall biosynthesis
MRAGRPILALTSDSYAGEIVAQTATGSCADPDDPTAIADLIRDAVEGGGRFREFRPRGETIDQFSREDQMKRLADVLDVAGSRRKSPVDTSP